MFHDVQGGECVCFFRDPVQAAQNTQAGSIVRRLGGIGGDNNFLSAFSRRRQERGSGTHRNDTREACPESAVRPGPRQSVRARRFPISREGQKAAP